MSARIITEARNKTRIIDQLKFKPDNTVMLKYVLLAFFFILNILAVIIWLSTGTAYLIFHLIAIYFVLGLLNASLYVNLRKSLRWQLINIFAAFCVGTMIFGYTKYFPNETSPLPSNPFENFLIMCPAALVMGSFGMLVNFGIRKFIVQLRAKQNSYPKS